MSRFLKFVYATISLGSVIATTLLFINLNFKASSNSLVIETKILKKGFTTKGYRPTADAKVDGIIKGFVFKKDQNINQYSTLQLTLQKGIVGWNTIEKIKLIK